MRDRDASNEVFESRSRVIRIAIAITSFALCACSGDARRQIVEQASSGFEVSGATSPQFKQRLSAGTYLVEVREVEIDLRVQVDSAATHAVLSDQVPRHGVIYAMVTLPHDDDLTIQLHSADHKTKQGRGELRLLRWRRGPGEEPGELERGFLSFSEAGQQCALGTPLGWSRSADRLYDAVTHFTAARDAAARAQAAYSLASLQYNVRDEWAAAVRATEVAAEAFAQAGDETGSANAKTLRAATEINVAAGMDASTHGAERKALFASVDRRLAEVTEFFTGHGLGIRAEYAVNMRGLCAVNVGDYPAAETLFSRAVDMAKANQDVAEQARSLANLASVHNLRGYMAQAAREYEALIPIVDHQSYQYALLLANYGFTLIALGDFDRALTMHLESLALYTKMGEETERALALSALGGLYLRMGDATRAIDTLRSAMTVHRRVSNINGLASTLRVAANAESLLGEHAVALDYLREAARIDDNPNEIALTNVLVAAQLRAMGRFPEAEAVLAGPLQSANPLAKASAISERAALRIAQGRKSEAIDDLKTANERYADLGLDYDRIDTNTALSRVLLDTGDRSGAALAADRAISIVRGIRVKSANPEWRARFLSASYAPFEARIDVELADDTKGPVAAQWNAFRTADGVRARSLMDELAPGAGVRGQAELPEDAVLRTRLTSLQLQLESRMQLQAADEAGTLALRRSIEETRAQIDSNWLRHGGIAAQDASLPATLAEVQRRLPQDTAVLAYFVGDLRGHGWLLSREGLRHASFEAGATLGRRIGAAVESARGAKDASAENQLASLVVGTLLTDVKEHRLLIIPDGPLNGIPFAALPAMQGGGLLLDRYVISYAPSLTLVLNRNGPSPTANNRVAVISDPIYAPDDRRLRLASAPTNGAFRGPSAPRPDNLTRLAYSAMEANAVSNAMGVDDTLQLSGFNATTDKVLGLASQPLRVLHFATHAVARRDEPEQSALYLTQFAPDGTELPANRLAASDIQRSGLHADLVVLSGCATGDGSELRGEGVLGLTYGFLANGSRAVVAALWPIEDASTARFMSAFYREYRKSGRAADALRDAQIETRTTASPAVWSSFVVRANEYP